VQSISLFAFRPTAGKQCDAPQAQPGASDHTESPSYLKRPRGDECQNSSAGRDPSLASLTSLFSESACSLSLPGGVKLTAEPVETISTEPWESDRVHTPTQLQQSHGKAARQGDQLYAQARANGYKRGHIQIEFEFAIGRSMSRRRRKIKMPPSSATFCECESRLCSA
jgi:hypothetical protein